VVLNRLSSIEIVVQMIHAAQIPPANMLHCSQPLIRFKVKTGRRQKEFQPGVHAAGGKNLKISRQNEIDCRAASGW
jgi:hypothetical protein